MVVLLTVACTSRGSPSQPPSAPADPINPVACGEQLFATQPCTRCHTLQGVPGASGGVGPDLSHVATAAAQRKAGMSVEEYLRESIVDPDAFTVPGYPRGLMPKLPLDQQQVDDLVAFLRTHP
jgi:mono/diheme cytochrome c family protein